MTSIRSELLAVRNAISQDDHIRALDIMHKSTHRLKRLTVKTFRPDVDLPLMERGDVRVHVSHLRDLSVEQLRVLKPDYITGPSVGFHIEHDDIRVIDINGSLAKCYSMYINQLSIEDAIRMYKSGVNVRYVVMHNSINMSLDLILDYLRAFHDVGVVFDHVNLRGVVGTSSQVAELLDLGYTSSLPTIVKYDSVESYIRCLPYLRIDDAVKGMLQTGHLDDLKCVTRKKNSIKITTLKELETLSSNKHLQITGPYVFDVNEEHEQYRDLINTLTSR